MKNLFSRFTVAAVAVIAFATMPAATNPFLWQLLAGTFAPATRYDWLDGTAALVGRAVDDAWLAELGKLVGKQVSPMRSTVTAAHHRRQVAAVAAQRLVRELWTA